MFNCVSIDELHAPGPGVHPRGAGLWPASIPSWLRWTQIIFACFAIGLLAIDRATGQPTAADPGEVGIQVPNIGFQGRARVGDWTGVLVQVTDRSSQPREVVVQLDIPDADGDTAQYQRSLTTNPGTKQNIWLYARLPFNVLSLSELNFSVRAVEDGKPGVVLGRHAARLSGTGALLQSHIGAIGVIGRRPPGLDLLSVESSNTNGTQQALPLGHEITEILDGLRLIDLPDRWMGYAMLSSLVWTGTPPELDPTALPDAQAQAIREWVQRGGHLIVVVPQVGQTWTSSTNRLLDLVPKADFQRQEGVDLNQYELILRGRREPDSTKPPLPGGQTVHTFKTNADAKLGDAMPIFNGPAGETLVTRRLVGSGAVTFIGINIASETIRQLQGIEADVFWNRVLGRRGELISGREMNERNNRNSNRIPYRQAAQVDTGIAAAITKTGQAAKGVLLAIVVFVAYWLLAGPIAFKTLKMRNRSQHAWVVFVVVAGVFAGIAWGGATLLRPTKTDAQHFTVIDEVYGQPFQHAHSWMSIFLPKFGDVPVGIAQEEGDLAKNTMTSWEAFTYNPGEAEKFPDARGYPVDSKKPDLLPVPSRSTVKSVELDWMGAQRWKMPLPDPDAPIRLRTNLPGSAARSWDLQGRLTHELPGTLKDVTVILVREQTSLTTSSKSALQAVTFAAVVPTWAPKTILDLGTVFPTGSGTSSLDQKLSQLAIRNNEDELSSGRRRNRPASTGDGDAIADDQLLALSFYSSLGIRISDTYGYAPVYFRTSTRRLDMSRWMTQPCVIVMGYLEDAGQDDPSPCPIPVTVDGRVIPTGGRTLVRWVYPLPADPPRVASEKP